MIEGWPERKEIFDVLKMGGARRLGWVDEKRTREIRSMLRMHLTMGVHLRWKR